VKNAGSAMTVFDYNGEGIWTREKVLARYSAYATKAQITPRDLSPDETSNDSGRRWVYPVMDKVIEGIAAGDQACIRIGIEFIEEDARFPFGKILKSNAARALRRANLTDGQKGQIRQRVFTMLRAGHVPHEFREYAKLVRAIGFDHEAICDIEPDSPYAARFLRHFEQVLRDDVAHGDPLL